MTGDNTWSAEEKREEHVTDAPLAVTSSAFAEGGKIPRRNTGFGEDVSPELTLEGLSPQAVTVAVIMDDLDYPLGRDFDHWTIWNLPAERTIPGNIPHGAELPNGARQGISYGRHCYRGPKQPFFIHSVHRYRFQVFALDCVLSLPSDAGRQALVSAMEGHILQCACLTGTYRRGE